MRQNRWTEHTIDHPSGTVCGLERAWKERVKTGDENGTKEDTAIDGTHRDRSRAEVRRQRIRIRIRIRISAWNGLEWNSDREENEILRENRNSKAISTN